jgi:hypothetical protein
VVWVADADSRPVQSVLGSPHLRLVVLLSLLAVVAGLAVPRIGGGHTPNMHVLTVSHPQAAQRHLDAMPLPSGFQRVACPTSKPSVCFKRFPSVVLSSASWTEIIDHLGVLVTKPSGCSHPRYLRPGYPTAVNCLSIGHLGREQIWLDAIDVVAVTRTGLRSTTRSFGSFTGTLIRVIDAGS